METEYKMETEYTTYKMETEHKMEITTYRKRKRKTS